MWSQRTAEKDDLSYFMLVHRWNLFSDSNLGISLLWENLSVQNSLTAFY